jgi:hypothetical protein
MPDNYPSASEMPRNLSQIKIPFEVVATEGKFRIVHIPAPYFEGYEYWIVNEKGFMWEPADNLDAAIDYLGTEEAREYNAGVG